MKNEAVYRKKIKSVLRGLSKYRSAAERRDEDRLQVLMEAILSEDAAQKQVSKAMEAIQREFVDYNELRVALPREVCECIGKDFPGVRAKAETIKLALNNVFDRFNQLSIDSLAEVPKKQIPRRLEELGLTSYTACLVAMFCFDVPVVPVDDSLAGCLEINGCVEPGSSLADVKTLVDKVVSQKDAPAAHELFRRYVERHAKVLARKRAAEAKVKAEAEAKARAEAEAKAKAKAEAEAAKKAEAEREAARLAREARRKKAARKPKAPAKAKKPRAARKASGAGSSAANRAGLRKK